ncbi:MAG: lamin tail domain-containing protein [Candidatus Magasanikbacteria bacterium]|nr:lamin tail domain-containing protein [Candidatus Magasanikbacteria bacterium]
MFGSFFVAQKLWAASTDIIINEIGSYATSTHEWIEVWNKGSSSVDLSSWKFWENNTNHSLKAVTTTDSVVAPGEYAVICQDGDVFLRDYPSFIGSVLDSAWISLSESGEEIGLKDESGNFVERFTYLPTSHFSLERKDPILNDYSAANWQENLFGNTVGVQNSNFVALVQSITSTTSSVDTTSTPETTSSTPESVTSTPTTTESEISSSSTNIWDWAFIKLNEILSDPNEGNEKVELYNSNSTTAEISSGSICDSTGTNCKLFSGNILGHDWLTVDLLTDRYLNNTGDAVVLKDENNNTIDKVTYGTDSLGAPSNAQSLIRKLDGVDTDSDNDWALTTDITLDGANQLVVSMVNSNTGNISNQSGGSINNLANNTALIKTIKSATNTAKSAVDPVKISWKLDWPYGLDINEDGIFSAQGTADPRGGEIKIEWNFGDSATSSGFIVSHHYATSGIYLVSVSGASTASTTGKKDFKIYVGQEFSGVQTQIKIGNYLVDATSSDDEFVEVQNFSTSSHNISGWKIKNRSGKEYEIPESTNISASGTLKFFRSITRLSFDKDGDEIRLTTPNDKEVDKVILVSSKVIKKEPADKTIKKEAKTVKTASAGNWVVVQGVVTALPGNFGSQYFYISDGEKGNQVYQYKKDFPNLKIGDKVTVRGEQSLISGVSRIKIANKNYITITGKDEKFEPTNLDDLDTQSVGALVKVEGDITSIKSNYLYIDDGNDETIIYFRTGANINKQDLKVGDKLAVVGILEQTKSGLRISPRSEQDIKVIGFSDQVLSQQVEADQSNQQAVKDKYLTATAGGVTTLILGFLAKSRGAIVVSGAKKVVSVAGRIIKRG